MRVAYLIDDIAAPGGAQKMAAQLAEATSSHPEFSMTVVSLESYTNPDLERRFRQAGCEVHNFAGSSLFDIGRLRALTGFLRGSFDLVHTNLVYSNTIGTIAARLARVPSVGGLRAVYFANDRKDGWRHAIEARVLKRLARGAMAVGPSTAEAHRARLSGLPITPIANPVTIPPPIDPATRATIRSSLGIFDDDVMIIAVGGFRHTKGYPDLVTAMARLASGSPSARLVIAGDGPLLDGVRQQVVDSQLQSRITFLGHRDDIRNLLGASDVYVSSSHTEGLSNAILEAMASGLPVVVTDVGDSASVVSDAAGRVVPPRRPDLLATALSELVADPGLRSRLGAGGLSHVTAHHQVAGWAASMLDFYRGALEQRRVPARRTS
jgi:L-malate glycosyltransferase